MPVTITRTCSHAFAQNARGTIAAAPRRMAKLRLVVALVAMTGCVHQDTTVDTMFPEPIEVNGPPGGDIESSWQAVGSPTSNAPVASVDPAAPGYAIGTVTDIEIDQTLDGYGEWIWEEDYGWVWRPYATEVGVDFTPYETCGSWVWTDDYGWVYGCDWEWGWLPFHYGQWGWFDDYWAWVPDYEWSPAWVDWRGGGGYVGWAPQVPVVRDHRHHTHTPRDHRGGDTDPSVAQGGVTVRDHRGPVVRDHRRATQRDSHWRFATVEDFGKRNIRAHLFKHAAEGLRVTTMVPRPPVRGNVRAVSAAAVMGDRHRPVRRSRPAIDYTPSFTRAPVAPPSRASVRSQASALRETPTAVEVPMENPPSIWAPGDPMREPTHSPVGSSSSTPLRDMTATPMQPITVPPPINQQPRPDANTVTLPPPVNQQPRPDANTFTLPPPVHQQPRPNAQPLTLPPPVNQQPRPNAQPLTLPPPVYQQPRPSSSPTFTAPQPVYQQPRPSSSPTFTPSQPVYQQPRSSSSSTNWQPSSSHNSSSSSSGGGVRSHRH